jgi:DNA topoisomerase-1
VKITVEKSVKQKPTLAELTKVEKPGKPTSADLLEDEVPAKKTKAKSKKTKATSTSKITKDSILIITEKPQAAQKIADAIGDARKYTEDGVSFFEINKDGNKIFVCSAVGHLFTLTYSKGQTGWPIFNLEWMPSFNKKGSAFTKKYYSQIKRLSARAKEFIIATDFDVEGEVIGWNVLRFICGQNTAKRMKFSTLTADELRRAFESPMPELNWSNAYAGETRHYVDWMYGINLSRALMSAIKTTGSFKILSIGRVQGPALKIIVDREKEIANFKSEPFWRLFAEVQGVELQHNKYIFDKKELDKFSKIKEGTAKTESSEEKMSPPIPFDLTSLQRESYKVLRLTPSQTLKVAQKLYLEGLISYPRTSSQKIPKEIEPKKILKKLEKYFPEVKQATRAIPIEGKKSDPAHPSIYPTGEHKELEGIEEKFYNLIVKRFIAAFSPDAKTANKKITLDANGLQFSTSGLVMLEKGWTSFYPIKIEEQNLPDINGKVKIDKMRTEDRETQPPKRYTAASLVSTLEKKNLGTKATRSSIVDTLFDRGYLDGTSIKATPLGMKLVEALEKNSPVIIDENLTREIEKEMEVMQEDTADLPKQEAKVIDHAKKMITDIANQFKKKEALIGQGLLEGITDLRKQQNEAATIMQCPTCKKGQLKILYSKKIKRYFVACSAYPECKQTYSLPPNAMVRKTEKVSDEGLPILVALRKGKRPWEFKFDPNWKENQANGNSPSSTVQSFPEPKDDEPAPAEEPQQDDDSDDDDEE